MAELTQEERLKKLKFHLMKNYESLQKNAQNLDEIGEVIKSIKENPENKNRLAFLYRKEFTLAIENKKLQDDIKMYAGLVIKLEPNYFKVHHILKTLKNLNRVLITE